MQVQRKIIEVHDTQVLLQLPQSFLHRRVEIIALTVDEEAAPATPPRRQPSPLIFGKGKTLGDIVSPIVEAGEWSEAP
jgi:hypothetical protein